MGIRDDRDVYPIASHPITSGSCSHGLRVESPYCCKRRRTTRAYTCCIANDPNFLLRASEEAARPMKAMRVKSFLRSYYSSTARVRCGRALSSIKNEVWANVTSKQTHMGKKYLLTIAIPGYRLSMENVELSSPVQYIPPLSLMLLV
ncbi:hypothetical protein TNCV_256061 [Trichonephila clavipes]|nr:hypothetical protein TNCV_256061 [Trichonephila clavipes]